jgi:hypothetical protein
MSKVRNVIGIIASVILILSSGLHSLMGWPAIAKELAVTTAPADLVLGLRIGWLWGGVAILVFGIITLATFVMRMRGNAMPTFPITIMGAAYTAFGVWALIVSREPFFLIFVVPGILLLIAAGAARA